MSIILITSSQERAGKSVIAAAIAWRMAQAGRAVTLARLTGDAGAASDAAAFAQLDGIASPGAPVTAEDLASAGASDLVVEAPAGDASAAAKRLQARVIQVARADASDAAKAGVETIVTRARAGDVAAIAVREGVLAALMEDRVLAAPSVEDIARAVEATWLAEATPRGTIDRVMIGTVASDAASPYFGARERKAVVTRYDKTDILLAALLTDVDMLVLTGGGAPSPYLMDRVQGTRDDITVVLAEQDTVATMRTIEGLYGQSRFDGAGKMLRAAALLDEAGLPATLD